MQRDTQRVAQLVVTGTPVTKKRARHGNGTHYTPDDTRQYEQTVAWTARATGRRFDRVPLHVEITFHVHRRTGDIDNLAKSILDGLEKGGLIPNDTWVDQLWLRRVIDRTQPERAIVTVTEIQEAAAA